MVGQFKVTLQKDAEPRRILAVWQHLPYYAFACLREASRRGGVTIDVISVGEGPNSLPQDERVNVQVLPEHDDWRSWMGLIKRVRAHPYDVALFGGWSQRFALAVAIAARTVGTMTVCMADTPWTGQLRQALRAHVARSTMRAIFDVIWIPGARALPLAQMLGFPSGRIWTGVYSTDQEMFGCHADARIEERRVAGNWPRRFIYVGRFAPEKNIVRLIQAYDLYHSAVQSPWELLMVGKGPLRSELERVSSIRSIDWLPPHRVSEEMAQAGAFVLPSTFEPWGLVVHEATCMGLPVLCSAAVGSSSDLVHDRVNGFVFDPMDTRAISQALHQMSEQQAPWKFGLRSRNFSACRSTSIWADTLLDGFRQWRERKLSAMT